MKDLFQNYHRHKVLSHLSIVGVSLVFALSINMFLFESNSGNMLKANILEGTASSDASLESIDFQVETENSRLIFTTQNPMTDVVAINYSLGYDASQLTLEESITSLEGIEIQELENEAGYRSVALLFDEPQNISTQTDLASINFIKQDPKKTSYLNPIEINFTDSDGNTYLLSGQGVKL